MESARCPAHTPGRRRPGGACPDTRPDIYTIEQVEVLKGPASVLFGQGSPGGIVNVVSKTPRADAVSEFGFEYGNFERTQIAADINGSIDREGRWLYRLIGVYRDTDTQVDFISEDAVVVAPSLTWRPGAETNVTLLANFQRTDSDAGAQFLPIHGTLLPAPNGKFIEPEPISANRNSIATTRKRARLPCLRTTRSTRRGVSRRRHASRAARPTTNRPGRLSRVATATP